MCLGKKIMEVKWHSHQFISRARNINISHQHWCWPWPPGLGFFPGGLTLLTPFHPVFFGRKSLCAAHIWGLGNVLLFLRAECLHSYLESSCAGDCLYPFIPSVIHLFSQSFIYVRMGSWAFILYFRSESNTTFLFCYSDCSSFDRWELFSWPLYPADILQVIVRFSGLVWFLSTFLLSSTARCSRHILSFLDSVLQSVIFPRSPGSFHWLMLLAGNIWVQDVCSLLLESTASWLSKKIE